MRTHLERASGDDPDQEADFLRYGYILLRAPNGPATWSDHGLHWATRAIDHHLAELWRKRHAIATELFIRDVAGTAP